MDLKTISINGRKVLPVSFSNPNIPPQVLVCQKAVFDKYGLFLNQHISDLKHSHFLDTLMARDTEIFIIMDVDMIPLKSDLYSYIVDTVTTKDCIIGIEQQCNCNASINHIYAGPACLGITKDLYEKIGRPSFIDNFRSDTAEEVTYRCQEKNIPVNFFPFISCEQPIWKLGPDRMFGIGSTYDRVYHHFQINNKANQDNFIKKCNSIINKI